jgi:hypothetical protein
VSVSEAALHDGVIFAAAGVRAAIEDVDTLGEQMYDLYVEMHERYEGDGLLVLGTALAIIAGEAVRGLAALADRPASDVLSEIEMRALTSAVN